MEPEPHIGGNLTLRSYPIRSNSPMAKPWITAAPCAGLAARSIVAARRALNAAEEIDIRGSLICVSRLRTSTTSTTTVKDGRPSLAFPRRPADVSDMKTPLGSRATPKAQCSRQRPHKVLGVTRDGVRILEPNGPATHFTALEIRDAIRVVRDRHKVR